MEDFPIFSAEFKCKINERDRVPPPLKLGSERKDTVISARVEKYITAYLVAERKTSCQQLYS